MMNLTDHEHVDSSIMGSGYQDLAPLMLLVLGLGSGAHILAGELAVPALTMERLYFMLIMVGVYGLIALVTALLHSVIEAPRHVDPATRTVNFRTLWRAVARNPLPGLLVAFLAACGCTSASSLTEIYRANASVWHDAVLWQLEFPLFAALQGSWLDRPQFWDLIYFQMWTFVLLAAVLVHRRSGLRSCAVLGSSIVLAFYLTRVINLAFPSAGPVFFQPHWFSLDGTLSQATQEILQAYTAGRIPANGVYPATMAMPSLHVGLTAMAAGFLAKDWRWTLWLSLPWLTLVWISTVMLGWHYALDGLGGVGVGGLAVFLAAHLQGRWDRLMQQGALASWRSKLRRAVLNCHRLLVSVLFRKYGKTEE